ncbi:MAG TPA: response regulator [Cytophagaceae bacterium]
MKKILLIEDNKDVRENTAEILELANYKVVTAENGKIGVELAKTTQPDLIICDVMMPELDGFGVLHVLSKIPATSKIPFIFLTAKSEKADFRKGMNLGADDYLTKPFDELELLDAVEIRLKKNELIKSEIKNSLDELNDIVKATKGLEELNQLLEDEKRVTVFKKRQNIFLEGKYPNSLYYIQKGKVKTYKTNEEGREYITGLYKEGDFLGYLNLLEESNYIESAMTLEDSEICIIHKQDFFKLLHLNKDVSEKFIKLLSKDLIEKEERLIKLAYNSVRKRVAEALLMLHKNFHDESEENFSMAISRDDLANIVGASKETVIRTITDFKEEGLIEISGSKITIIEYNKLARMRN